MTTGRQRAGEVVEEIDSARNGLYLSLLAHQALDCKMFAVLVVRVYS